LIKPELRKNSSLFKNKNSIEKSGFYVKNKGKIKFGKSFAIDCLEYMKTFYTFRKYSIQNIYNRFNRFESRKRPGLYPGLF